MKTYRLSVSSIEKRKEFHKAIAELMSFPEWYGNNLDALSDVLTDIGEETLLIIEGVDLLEENLKSYLPRIIKVLEYAQQENPKFHYEIAAVSEEETPEIETSEIETSEIEADGEIAADKTVE